MPATRQEVYEAIDSEREYHSRLTRKGVETNLAKGLNRHWAMDLITIRKIVRAAEDWSYDNAGELPMDFMRKIAAVAVKSMEQNGAPKRA